MEHRTALGIFLTLVSNRSVTALNSLSLSARQSSGATGKRALSSSSVDVLVDVDANLLHPDLVNDIEHHLQVID